MRAGTGPREAGAGGRGGPAAGGTAAGAAGGPGAGGGSRRPAGPAPPAPAPAAPPAPLAAAAAILLCSETSRAAGSRRGGGGRGAGKRGGAWWTSLREAGRPRRQGPAPWQPRVTCRRASLPAAMATVTSPASSTFPRGPCSSGAGSRLPPSGDGMVGTASVPASSQPLQRSRGRGAGRRAPGRPPVAPGTAKETPAVTSVPVQQSPSLP